MVGMFDDLIPPQRQLISPNMFADLIPQNRAAAQQAQPWLNDPVVGPQAQPWANDPVVRSGPDLSGYSDEQLQQMLKAQGGTDLSRYSDAELHQMLQAQGKQLIPVDHDPFATSVPKGVTFVPVDHDPFADNSRPLTIKAGAGTTGGAVAGAPEAIPGSAQAAFGHGVASGVPIIGPYIAQGADHLAAGIRSLARGEKYGDALSDVQNFATGLEQQHPSATWWGNQAGAVAGLAPAVAAAPVAFGAGEGALAGRALLGGLTGSGIGAADSGVRSGGDLDAMQAGAFAGAAGGALGPVAGAIGSRVISGAGDAIAQAAALRGLGLSSPAARALTRSLGNDGSFGGQGAANIAAAGPDSMLADTGPNARQVLDTALQRGGPAAQAARQSIEDRASASASNLAGQLDQALGAPQGVYSATNALRNGTAVERGEAYRTAYDSPIDYSSPQAQAILDHLDRIPTSAISRANQLMQIEGHAPNPIATNAHGHLAYQPDVRELDYITRSLNDVAQRGDGQGALGGNTAEGRAYGNLSRDIRSSLREAVPAYGDALDAARDPISQREALDFGAGLLNPNMARDEVEATISRMSPGQVQYARQGLRSAIDEHLANVKAVASDPNTDIREGMRSYNMLSSRAAQDKLAQLVPEQYHTPMAKALDEVGRDQQLRGAVTRSSGTYARQATDQAIKDAVEPGPIGRLTQGEPLQAGKAATQWVFQTRPADQLAKQDRIYGELTQALTGPRGADAQALLEQLERANRIQSRASSIVGSLPVRPSMAALALMGATEVPKELRRR